MGLNITSVNFKGFATDPVASGLSNGEVFYNSTENLLKINLNGTITPLSADLVWRQPVKDKDLSAPPGSPVAGDTYIVGSSPTGAWAGQADSIAIFNGTIWNFTVPVEGYATWVEDEDRIYTFDGTVWKLIEKTLDHGDLTGLGDDDHIQYLLVDGSRPMSGALQMGGFPISGVPLPVSGTDAANKDYVDQEIAQISGTVVSRIVTFTFGRDDSANDKWLGFADSDITTDNTWAILPYDATLDAITFSNTENDADTDVEIYVAASGDTNNKVKVLKWPLRNARVACSGNFSPAVTFNAGDKIGIFNEDKGSNPNNVAVSLFLRITGTPNCNYVESFDGGFDVAGESS